MRRKNYQINTLKFSIKKLVFLTLLSTIFICRSVVAESPIAKPDNISSLNGWKLEWSGCLVDSECRLVSYGPGCYWIGAINQAYMQDITQFLSNTYKNSCTLSFFDWLFSSPKCISKMCIP